ncbi:hypothetical protein N7501_007712 [Penicillium viridicatum]|nr:hypothetical protein N7501_007712 [Penicillium viridicatum]
MEIFFESLTSWKYRAGTAVKREVQADWSIWLKGLADDPGIMREEKFYNVCMTTKDSQIQGTLAIRSRRGPYIRSEEQ